MGQFWSGRRRMARTAAACVLIALTATIAGCAQPGGLTGHLSGAASQASSSAASAALALELYLDGDSTGTVADITLVNMLNEAGQAGSSASAQVVTTGQERRLRADVAGAISAATDQIVDSRSVVAGAAPRSVGPGLVSELRKSADALDATATELEAAAR